MRLLQQAVGQQSDCKRDPPLSAKSCSGAPPILARFAPHCLIHTRVNAKTRLACCMLKRKQRRCGAHASDRMR
jgi:hypothetical protein